MNITLNQVNKNADNAQYQGDFALSAAGWYRISLEFETSQGQSDIDQNNYQILIDNLLYGNLKPDLTVGEPPAALTIYLTEGTHTAHFTALSVSMPLSGISVEAADEPQSASSDFKCCNPNASEECRKLMKYLKSIYGKKILTGQQTSYLPATELDSIQNHAGQLPALRGFDLMSYSLSTDTPEQTPHCQEELATNPGSIEEAIKWFREYHGLVTFCWHWFSPLNGRNKSFYTEDTDFDIVQAVIPGTPEYEATLKDIDAIAVQLKRLENEKIPVLWRPLHEAFGGWFWWGAKSAEAFNALYILMYERLTNFHKINNLIWVWNSPAPGWYPGDEYVDILSTDIYAPALNYGPLTADYVYTNSFSPRKPAALGENGPIPDPDLLQSSKTPWLWFLTWGGGFVNTEENSTFSHVKHVYDSEYTIALKDLPSFY